MPWGDYGEVLYAGWGEQDKETGKFYVSRTAPFVPEVYRDLRLPFLFVTDSLKKKLEQSPLNGLNFQEAVKDRIVSLDWEKWDLSAPEPAVYPSGDMDAEEYIVRRKHNAQLAGAMGTIWAVIFPAEGFTTKEGELITQSVGDSDIFAVEINSDNDIFVSERAMTWFTEHGENCLRFEPCATKTGTDKEMVELKKSADEKRLRQEKSAKMTDKDWQLWHRLKNEAEKLLKNLDTAKREETRLKWKQKACENIKAANEIYPINEREMEVFQKLM